MPMKIQVTNDDGTEAFSYDTAKSSLCLSPGLAERPAVVAALTEATSFLGSDQHVITSISADIRAAVARIETELGAHPAFTWVQTKLGNAISHLEAYAKGLRTEPEWPEGVALNERGMIVPAAEGVITNPRA
jgi:hypothetical protein